MVSPARFPEHFVVLVVPFYACHYGYVVPRVKMCGCGGAVYGSRRGVVVSYFDQSRDGYVKPRGVVGAAFGLKV